MPSRLQLTAVLLWTCVAAGPATQPTKVVRVTDDVGLRTALRTATAGTQIRIAPGKYHGGLFATIHGEAGKPIEIIGDDPARPPMIEGGENGLQLADASHIAVRDVVFRGATANGLNIDNAGRPEADAVDITLDRVRVQETAVGDSRNGIKLSGVGEFTVRNCIVRDGWGGSAIDMVGCRDGVIEGCTFADAEQGATGPQMKGGSTRITIRGCTFSNAGLRAINAGGSTGERYFRPHDADYEARDLTIEDNVFTGSDAAIAFVGVDGATVRNNTIIEPTKWVFRILQESRGERFVPCRNVRIEKNLVVYRSAVNPTINIGPGTQPETFVFEGNWWWCADKPTDRPTLPSAEHGGSYGVDPKVSFDASGTPVPVERRARGIGAPADR